MLVDDDGSLKRRLYFYLLIIKSSFVSLFRWCYAKMDGKYIINVILNAILTRLSSQQKEEEEWESGWINQRVLGYHLSDKGPRHSNPRDRKVN